MLLTAAVSAGRALTGPGKWLPAGARGPHYCAWAGRSHGQRGPQPLCGPQRGRVAIPGAAAARGWRSAAGTGRTVRAVFRARPPSPAPACPVAKMRRSSSREEERARPARKRQQITPPCGYLGGYLGFLNGVRPDPAVDDRGRLRGRGSGAGQGWGGCGIAVRLVLAALGQAAMVSGSSVIEFRTRNLALHSAFPWRDPAGAPDRTRSRRYGRPWASRRVSPKA